MGYGICFSVLLDKKERPLQAQNHHGRSFFFRVLHVLSVRLSGRTGPHRNPQFFLTDHNPAGNYRIQLSVAATDQQQRRVSPAHKNKPSKLKTGLKGCGLA